MCVYLNISVCMSLSRRVSERSKDVVVAELKRSIGRSDRCVYIYEMWCVVVLLIIFSMFLIVRGARRGKR